MEHYLFAELISLLVREFFALIGRVLTGAGLAWAVVLIFTYLKGRALRISIEKREKEEEFQFAAENFMKRQLGVEEFYNLTTKSDEESEKKEEPNVDDEGILF